MRKKIIILVLWLVAVSALGQTTNNFLIKNNWPYTVMASYSDVNGQPVAVSIVSGGTYNAQSVNLYAPPSFQIYDPTTFDGMSSYGQVATVYSDGTANDMIIQVMGSFTGSPNIYNLAAAVYQYPGALSGYSASSQLAGSITIANDPALMTWFWSGFDMAFVWYGGFGLVKRIVTKITDHSPNL